MKRKILLGGAAMVLAGQSFAGQAATIIFEATGFATGTGPSGSFNNAPIKITATADTGTKRQCSNNGAPIANCFLLINSGLTIELIGVGSAQLTNPSLSIFNAFGNFSFQDVYQLPPNLAIRTLFATSGAVPPSLTGYDLVSPVPLTSLQTVTVRTDQYLPGPPTSHLPIQTSAGAVILTQNTFGRGSFRAFLQPAVPEPATWAMMIMGFGFIGAAMRRRRQNLAVSCRSQWDLRNTG